MGSSKTRLHLLLAAGVALAIGLVSGRSFTQIQPLPTGVTPFKPQGTLTPQPGPTITDGAFAAQANQVTVGADAPVNVAQLSLKPGQYVIHAKVVGTNGSGPQIALACGLTTQSPWSPQENGEIDYSSVTIASESRLPLALTGTVNTATAKGTTPIGTPLYLACRSSGGTTNVRWARLVAQAVTHVN